LPWKPPSPQRLYPLDFTKSQKMVMLPWEGRFSNYRVCDGMTVPFTGEVAWVRPEGHKSYFLGTVTTLTYTFSP
jgi:hypothetical protein